MITYYYRQIDRASGELLGYVSYDDYLPNNNNETILLEEMSFDEFRSLFSADNVDAQEEE